MDLVGNPTVMRRINGWAVIFWLVMIPVSVLTGWINSVAYVSALSIYALVAAHWSTWASARVEEKQDRAADEIVDKMVERTEVNENQSQEENFRETP